MFRKLRSIIFTTLLLTLTATPMTSLATSGSITDYTPSGYIAGVWVEVYDGDSGWAYITPYGSRQKVSWSYDTEGLPFCLHIGVGGSPENWDHNVHTPTLVDKGKRFYIDVHYSASSWNAPSYFTKVRTY